jgi:hypothetical protein
MSTRNNSERCISKQCSDLPRIARNGSEAEKKESRGNREMKKSTFLRLARSVLR